MGLALPGEGLTLHEVPAEGCAELYDRGLWPSAQAAWIKSGSNRGITAQLGLGRRALLEYCRLDAEALMKVYLELRNLARG